jgi:hypothetical protein
MELPEFLKKLGVTKDTDPNDPSTWSDELLEKHANHTTKFIRLFSDPEYGNALNAWHKRTDETEQVLRKKFTTAEKANLQEQKRREKLIDPKFRVNSIYPLLKKAKNQTNNISDE